MMHKAGAAGREDLFSLVGRRFKPDQMMPSEGAFIVQHAIDTRSGQEAVIKRPKDALSARQMASLSVERAALAGLSHPGIPRLLGAALDSPDPYLAMGYLDGMKYSMNNILDDREAYIVRLTVSACQALKAAHGQGIVHRDICPANLVLSHDRSTLSVIDFGVAYVPGMPDLGADRIVGRPDFMAPEQTVPGAKADARADVYSLGTIAYMYLSGHSPFPLGAVNDEAVLAAHRERDPARISEFAPWIPPQLQAAVMRSIARRPEARFGRAEDFADALCNCLGLVERLW